MSYAFDKDAEDGATVTLENGATYQFDAAKDRWLVKFVAGVGGGADGEVYATKAFVDQIEEASVFRDEAIKADLEDKDRKQTAAILVVEGDVQNEAKNRKIGDDRLQEQIDAIDIPEPDLSGYMPLDGDSTKTGRLVVKTNDATPFEIQSGNGTALFKMWSSGAVSMEKAYSNFKDNELVNKKYVDNKVDSVDIPEIPEPVKSVISTQLMPRATTTYDMAQGQFTLRQRQGGSTLSPQLAFGIRYFPSTEDDWWKDTHEAIAGGYISVVDPAYGLVKWGGVIESVEEDGAGRLLFITSAPFANGDNLDSRQYLLTLSGCLKEK